MGTVVTVSELRVELGGANAYDDVQLEGFIATAETHWIPKLTDAAAADIPEPVHRGLVLASALAVKAAESPSPYAADDMDAGAVVPVTPVNTDPRLRWCFLDYLRPGVLVG